MSDEKDKPAEPVVTRKYPLDGKLNVKGMLHFHRADGSVQDVPVNGGQTNKETPK